MPPKLSNTSINSLPKSKKEKQLTWQQFKSKYAKEHPKRKDQTLEDRNREFKSAWDEYNKIGNFRTMRTNLEEKEVKPSNKRIKKTKKIEKEPIRLSFKYTELSKGKTGKESGTDNTLDSFELAEPYLIGDPSNYEHIRATIDPDKKELHIEAIPNTDFSYVSNNKENRQKLIKEIIEAHRGRTVTLLNGYRIRFDPAKEENKRSKTRKREKNVKSHAKITTRNVLYLYYPYYVDPDVLLTTKETKKLEKEITTYLEDDGHEPLSIGIDSNNAKVIIKIEGEKNNDQWANFITDLEVQLGKKNVTFGSLERQRRC